MKIDATPKFPLTPDSILQHTGRKPEDWYATIDSRLGANAGRRAVGDLLFKELKVDAWWTTTLAVGYEAARGVVEKDGRPRGYSICATKSIAATPDRVFTVIQGATWAGAGTKLNFIKATPGKMARFTFEGSGHPVGELVEIKLTAAGAKCSIVVNHERIQDRGRADGLRVAWGSVLDGWKTDLE